MPSDRWQPRRHAESDRDSTFATSALEAERNGESSQRSPRADRDSDRFQRPNKARRLGDKDISRSGLADQRDDRRHEAKDRAGPSSPRRTDTTRDTGKPPALTIRGVAATQITSSPPRQNQENERARSPDLFDRLGRRGDESSRSRPDSSLRSRLDEARDGSRRGAAKLAPRGTYDDDGRRIGDSAQADSRDRNRAIAKDDVPTSPRRRETNSRWQRDRSDSPDVGRSRYRGAVDEADGGYRDTRGSRDDRNRRSRRSPSPASTDIPRRDAGRYDRYERRRSPQRSDRHTIARGDDVDSATGTPRARRWGTRGGRDGDQQDDDLGTNRRRRTPSPARSDASHRSQRRDRDIERAAGSDRQRERPARWRLDNSNDTGDSSARGAQSDLDGAQRRDQRRIEQGRERRRSPDDRRARTPPRGGRADENADRGHVLSRKSAVSATLEGTQPPTGPRRPDAESNQRSVRGGGWQTVRPGAQRDRDAARDNGAPIGPHNGHDAHQAVKRPKTPPPAPPVEPPRAEPGEAYVSIHQVGEGTYGQVFKARSELTGALVALKKIRMDAEKDGFPVTAMREIKLLQALRHENIVRLHEMMVTRGSIYMVFEYMEHDLNGILAHPQVQFTQAHLKSLAGQLFSGLDYLHRKAVLHRDLKGSNILLNNQGRLKLADFGLARFYAKRRLGDYTNRVVTLWYRPPELLFGETQYGSEVDMWGAGCIFLELFVKKPVFQSETEIGQVTAITDILGPVSKDTWPDVDKLAWFEMVKPTALPTSTTGETQDYVKKAFGKYLPDTALEVARGLLTYNPRERWSAKQALEAKYFREGPRAEMPGRVLSGLGGEWHEYESRRAKKKATGHRGTDTVAATVATTAGSTDPVSRAGVGDQQLAVS